ncbi:p110_5L [African swine fever virus]|uniref:p110_5L n=1 Tax=African swine fever virus TaxID=10497 RepID=A0A8A1V5U6_ASF|nr:p110_5L [African swine fever virus]
MFILAVIFFPLFLYDFIWIPVFWLRTDHYMFNALSQIVHTFIYPAGNYTWMHILIFKNCCISQLIHTKAILSVPAKLATFHVCAPVFKFILCRIFRWMQLSNELACDLVGQKAKNSQEDYY